MYFSEKTGAKTFTETDQVFSSVWHSLEPPGFGRRVFPLLGSQAAGSGSSRSQAALSSGHGREQQQSIKLSSATSWTRNTGHKSQYHSPCSTLLREATHPSPSHPPRDIHNLTMRLLTEIKHAKVKVYCSSLSYAIWRFGWGFSQVLSSGFFSTVFIFQKCCEFM